MEDAGSRPPAAATAATTKDEETSLMCRVKKWWACFAASLQEGFTYVKANLVGQGKKMRARNEREAAEADLQTAKMQVEAADAAETTKKTLHHSM
ncbi:uncharacterized protein LOC131162931 [Malania oleifera]|uniref:uncharacterized protein LOC131162931 n=1 Tax=Malania oleifera TaxID=397392 RepID=UPI0025ADFA17|nr:uncharacterized protein LOC131162931 [Malania oleifera]